MHRVMLRLVGAGFALVVLGVLLSIAFDFRQLTAQSADGAEAKRESANKNAVGPARDLLKETRQRGTDFLRNTQADDGSWTTRNAPGITALATMALLESGIPLDDPTVARGLACLEDFVQPNGGIYFAGGKHRNYETCIASMVFQRANRDGKYDTLLANAEKFLRTLQWDEGEGLESSDTSFGGAGYGKHERPDVSNTQFLMETLRSLGAPEDDPALQKALLFVSRAQNLETEHNTTPFAAKVNDGGFYYTPAAGGTSQAGTTPDGGLRSYGSMTYAGLKSMIYAGLRSDDPRVRAAFGWIQKFYTVDENPGMGKQGLYYYYHTFAKALSVLEADHLVDADGTKHDWRKELTRKLADLQRSHGGWVNEAERWYEGDPNLATAYALLALAHCDPKPVIPAGE